MLYDEAIKHIDTAIDLLDKGDKRLDLVNNSIIKAQDMVTELMVSLDFDRGGEIAMNLNNLYFYFNQQLMEANIQKNCDMLRPVRSMIADLREAWNTISSQVAVGAENHNRNYHGVNIAG